MPNPALLYRERTFVLREFHVSRWSRDRYGLDEQFFSFNGNVIFTNFRAVRLFAQRINERRDVLHHPERSVSAGDLNAMGLVDEILHYIVAQYRLERNPRVMEEALVFVQDRLGKAAVEETLVAFLEQFPPVAVYKGEMTLTEYLASADGMLGEPVRAALLEELMLLWLANENPAAAPFIELFDDGSLEQTQAYPDFADLLRSFFSTQPTFGPADESLFDILRGPALAAPGSWHAQLAYIRNRWGGLLGTYLTRLLSSLDFLEEEAKVFFGFGPGPVQPPEFAGMAAEPEAFSPDQDWMPRAVMLAKNVYVWLDQLAQAYGREIRRLDEVPDAELDRLRHFGFTALWLIGLWERSKASRRIKQIMGNPEAVASAYSILTYGVAEDLGGEAAFEDLRSRAWVRGIRMASDMVPNHMGIDSDWVIQHPDWFVSLDYSPFPSYSFSGPDLCEGDRVGVYLEDHYYEHTDAAVVFQRRDHWTGDTRYIYHGNDGTQMPWNDTAQLNYLNPDVREAVIRTILDVARRSPIIRFDAAMTLAKRHYQRLWFPEPGTGGDIASRSEFGLTKAEFDRRMPEEFWREVVDRVAAEVPDTLLLAEAFWMMEGYFVRSLGMHRVYNSAFMNMLRDEQNAEYREVMKNTLEFDPEILRRYVNFMNNPDERTAVDQFGKGDKYFGVCTMMLTVPGLPMLGHGQIEGYAEKYGMEFRKAYWNEQPDLALVERHERQVVPLIRQRYLFAGVEAFYLYDFFTSGGGVDENVFAYSNRVGDERALVLYHNRYGDTRGWVRSSVAYAVKGDDGAKALVQTSLAEALGISDDPNRFLTFRDAISGQAFISSCRDLAERGLFAELFAYQAYVFLDFREIEDNASGHYAVLNGHLQGRGVAGIDEALQETLMGPLHVPLRMLVSAPAFRWLVSYADESRVGVATSFYDDIEQKMLDVLQGATLVLDEDQEAGLPEDVLARGVVERLALLLALPDWVQQHVAASKDAQSAAPAVEFLLAGWSPDDVSQTAWELWGALFGWVFTYALGGLVDAEHISAFSRDWFDEWLLRKLVTEALVDLGVPEDVCRRVTATIRLLLAAPDWMPVGEEVRHSATHQQPAAVLRRALRHRDVQAYLGLNHYEDVLWFNREAFEQWLWWMLCLEVVQLAEREDEETDVVARFLEVYRLITQLQTAAVLSAYQVDALIEAAQTLSGEPRL